MRTAAARQPGSQVRLSGGMDSCVTAALAARVSETFALHLSYGQRTEARESTAARAVALRLGLRGFLPPRLDIPRHIGGSALTDATMPVPDAKLDFGETSASSSSTAEAIPVTYVPFRNAHFLSAAVSWAEVLGAAHVPIRGVEQDSSGDPDCRPAYYEAFRQLVRTGTRDGNIEIVTPLIANSKAEIVSLGLECNAPLDLTWSCYREEQEARGSCESCVLRLRAFQEAGVEDPISMLPLSVVRGADPMKAADLNTDCPGAPPCTPTFDFKEKTMKIRSLLSLAAAGLLSVSIAVLAQAPTGKIHGRVTDPTGMPKAIGTVSLSTDGGHTLKYSFPVTATGDFTGDGIAPGDYTVVFRLPDTAEGKLVDHIDNVKISAGDDVHQDVDMSRQAYIDQMTPEQKKQVEEFKKKNAEVMQKNQVIKNLNADLNDARTANHDKKYEVAETLMLKDTGLKPDGELLWYELGNAEIGLKKWDDATASLKKAIDLSTASKKPSPELIGGAHAGLGEVYARTSKPDDAAAEYDLAAKANPPKTAFYYTNEAVIFSQAGNNDAQGSAADKAITADPKSPLPYYLKGQALISKASVDPKTQAIVLPPGCAEAYEKYLDLAPDGQFANDVKGILAQSQTKVETKYKAKK